MNGRGVGKPVDTVETVDKSAPSVFAALFPKTKWDTETFNYDGLQAQVLVVAEEAGELASAVRKEAPERVMEEAADVMLAASGVLHRLAAITGTTPEEVLRKTTAKNHERDYYPIMPGPLPSICTCGDDCGNF